MDPVRPAYPLDPWEIREETFDRALLPRSEAVFALGNGHLGLRGAFEEAACNVADGTYVNGFYEREPITYGEIAYGYPTHRQVMLNVANAKPIQLHVGGEAFDLSAGEVLAYQRRLDLRTGLLDRRVRWRSPGGVVVELHARRLVSFTRPELAAIDYAVRVVEGDALLRVDSVIAGDVQNLAAADDPRLGVQLAWGGLVTAQREAGGTAAALVQRTRNSGLTLACAVDHAVAPGPPVTVRAAGGEGGVGVTLEARGALRFTKWMAYCTSRDHAPEAVLARARAVVREAGTDFEAIAAEQRAYLDAFWRAADVEIDGDEAIQQGLRFALFSLLQAAGRDGRTSVAAKGLTGEGYDGHYFWDTEIYVLPFFVYCQPELARGLVRFRCGGLPAARRRAAEMSQRGALFPWRTIDGTESSAYYPAGTAQYHIDADIAFALRQYVRATGDRALLLAGGAEVILETARLWADLGHFNPAREGAFCIDEVTGPDEYSALVNNNLYTNLMARENLEYAVEVARDLAATEPAAWARLTAALGIEEGEVATWAEAARRMCLPFDAERGIHCQDDQFLEREPWDFAGTPAEKYPLLLHFHPLVIYRHQVLKQPDVVLAQVLLPGRFGRAEKRRNFAYYDALTTGDSSLAPCVQGIAAADLGAIEDAYAYFVQTARMDLDDVHGNSAAGLHMAALGGAWLSVMYGFAGMRDQDGRLGFSPRLPARWRRLRFALRYQGRRLEVTLTHRAATYALADGEPLAVLHRGRKVALDRGAPVTLDLAPALEAVVLDLDGVVTDTAEYHYQAWARLAAEFGMPFDRTLNERLKGVSRMESLEIILRNVGVNPPQRQKELLAQRKNAYYEELIERVQPGDLLPGVAELLRRLRAEGVRVAIASASHNVWKVVARLGIGGLVDHVVDPAAVVKGKPDPEIFLRAAEALGVPPEHCAGVEDAAVGVTAIRQAGMFTVGVGRDLPGAHWVVPDTAALTLEALRERFRAWGAPAGEPGASAAA